MWGITLLVLAPFQDPALEAACKENTVPNARPYSQSSLRYPRHGRPSIPQQSVDTLLGMIPICPFCEVGESKAILRTAAAFAIADGFPVTPGHTLVIPNRHIATYWEATETEKTELWGLVERAREMLLETLHPDGFNVGFNSGQAAGQTVDHVHVIPRYDGDMEDPSGGVRGVIPSQMRYKE